MTETAPQTQNSLFIPLAIVIAGLLIAGAILMKDSVQDGNQQANEQQGTLTQDSFRFPDKNDYFKGNPDAKITIVEYSDIECPYCASFHPTMQALVDKYDVKWIYRHFPLSSIHPRAVGAAVATECAGELGGNDAFWSMTDTLISNQRGLSEDLYIETANTLGLDTEKFTSCLDSKDALARVQEDLSEVQKIGGTGTPHSIIITPSGELVPVGGALPLSTLEPFIAQLLAETE